MAMKGSMKHAKHAARAQEKAQKYGAKAAKVAPRLKKVAAKLRPIQKEHTALKRQYDGAMEGADFWRREARHYARLAKEARIAEGESAAPVTAPDPDETPEAVEKAPADGKCVVTTTGEHMPVTDEGCPHGAVEVEPGVVVPVVEGEETFADEPASDAAPASVPLSQVFGTSEE